MLSDEDEYPKKTCTLNYIDPDIRYLIEYFIFPQNNYEEDSVVNHCLTHTCFNNQDPALGFESNERQIEKFKSEGKLSDSLLVHLKNCQLLEQRENGKICLHRHILAHLWSRLLKEMMEKEIGAHTYWIWVVYETFPSLQRRECIQRCKTEVEEYTKQKLNRNVTNDESLDLEKVLSQTFEAMVRKRILQPKDLMIKDYNMKPDPGRTHGHHDSWTGYYVINYDSLYVLNRNQRIVEYCRKELGVMEALICKVMLDHHFQEDPESATGLGLEDLENIMKLTHPHINSAYIEIAWNSLVKNNYFGSQVSGVYFIKGNTLFENRVKPEVLNDLMRERFGRNVVKVKNALSKFPVMNMQKLQLESLLQPNEAKKALEVCKRLGMCIVEDITYTNPQKKDVDLTIIRKANLELDTDKHLHHLYKSIRNLHEQLLTITKKTEEMKEVGDENYLHFLDTKKRKVMNTIDLLGRTIILLEYGQQDPFTKLAEMKSEGQEPEEMIIS